MKTILITGHDTGIGKTWVTRFIAKSLSERKERVQIIKPVETGIDTDIANAAGDISTILKMLDLQYISGFTLNSFKAPLAPLSAGALEEKSLSIKGILKQIGELPQADWRLIETAGGLAVPLDISGADGRDLAIELNVDYIVLVVQNRLGAINQARLLEAYTPQSPPSTGFWLNDTHPRDPLVTESNLSALKSMKRSLWSHQGYEKLEPDFCCAPFLNLNSG